MKVQTKCKWISSMLCLFLLGFSNFQKNANMSTSEKESWLNKELYFYVLELYIEYYSLVFNNTKEQKNSNVIRIA